MLQEIKCILYCLPDRVCKRPWNFERVPNSMIEGHDKALIFTSTKEACLAACLNEKNFVCRSAEYNYVTLQGRRRDSRPFPVEPSAFSRFPAVKILSFQLMIKAKGHFSKRAF